jgi:DNA repair exonuclease SbcCD ATPase subunit
MTQRTRIFAVVVFIAGLTVAFVFVAFYNASSADIRRQIERIDYLNSRLHKQQFVMRSMRILEKNFLSLQGNRRDLEQKNVRLQKEVTVLAQKKSANDETLQLRQDQFLETISELERRVVAEQELRNQSEHKIAQLATDLESRKSQADDAIHALETCENRLDNEQSSVERYYNSEPTTPLTHSEWPVHTTLLLED